MSIGLGLYHRIGSLLPPERRQPGGGEPAQPPIRQQFLQVYFCASEDEQVSLRLDGSSGLDPDIVRTITQVLLSNNAYARLLYSAKERSVQDGQQPVAVRLRMVEGAHRNTADPRHFSKPTADEVGVIVPDSLHQDGARQ